MITDSFYNLIISQHPDDKNARCPNITLQVTEDCCLNCSYCYQIHKSHKMMSFQTGQKIIDQLFSLYDEDNEDYPINKHSYGIIIEFIGGEPFMNIDVINKIADYFVSQCIQKQHIWLNNFRFSIATNGLLYFDPKVQQFLKKYKDFISLTVSIDGPKILHDACRKDFQGNGSFDRAISAMRHYRDNYQEGLLQTIKVTIAPENLPYLDQIFSFFLDEHAQSLHANPIFEHNWTIEEGKLYYKQLILLANRLLQNSEHVSTFLFQESAFQPMTEDNNHNSCGGTGNMLAYDPDGNAYPCLRYMPSSLGDSQPPLIIGNYNNIYKETNHKQILHDLKQITRRSQSDDECWDCPIAEGCGWCSAYNYQFYGTCNKRCKTLCWMHRAKSLANVYYWNLYYRKHNIDKNFAMFLPKQIACEIISHEEYDKLLNLSRRW